MRSYPAADTFNTNRADRESVIVVQWSVGAAILRLQAVVTTDCTQTESHTNVVRNLLFCLVWWLNFNQYQSLFVSA